MIQLKDIVKIYKGGANDVEALKGINLSFRENEFVAILGPSGGGKTTLLNIVGGLDKYTSGDLIINGKSTVNFSDREWDSYRNHSVGFVFQSYNLIPHQSVLSNVELALTISQVRASERKQRAIDALTAVGLADQIHKKPNQLSGGQMQRVAIARALVNNPDIILADEPTGALDTQSSLAVMDLLKEVAKDRLVVMVTHNPELAEKYATRIIRLSDGMITDDSNPYVEQQDKDDFKYGKTNMSFFTALGLSLNNLLTKKGRTILTSFAGSIGIIGIALILSLSTGVDKYIDDVQANSLSSYPLTI
ncbi:MAG: ABC transporter ATP-binding protein, partial [Erysipelotrichaceae bacterium]|nr:ABC transporter ATP-binding protein [Erysipelotrichaceae bacterium]